MNPAYVRLQIVREVALARFAAWLDLPELEPPTVVHWSKAVAVATESGVWRGAAFFVFENDGWTVFEDITGHLGTKTTQDWLRLAAKDALVFAGYNDSIPYAQIVVINDGQIVREFLDDEQNPSQNVNGGRLGFEDIYPIQSWVEAASFVDGDDKSESQDYGMLWIFRTAS